jgi:ABC-type dipeptide/oligopeptide/nickel transport system ATPase component
LIETSLLRIELSASYKGKPALRGVALSVRRGEVVALIGQSGSGKSTLALAVMGLLGMRGGKAEGRVEFEGIDLLGLGERELRRIRGRKIGLVFQSGSGALNPRLTVEDHLVEAWRAHARGKPDFERVLPRVCLPADARFRNKYPRELSAGQAQRVLIALGIMHDPALLIADEPTSALDAITQAEILALLGALGREHGTGIVLITHDLLGAASVAGRVAILKDGTLVEQGTVGEIFGNPKESYTQKLIGALPHYPESLTEQLENLGNILQPGPGMADKDGGNPTVRGGSIG